MKNSIFYTSDLLTPAYIYDHVSIINVLDKLVDLKEKTDALKTDFINANQSQYQNDYKIFGF